MASLPQDAIDVFLLDAQKRLSRLPSSHQDRALTEAKSHLRERAAELRKMGLSPEQAANEAVAIFGDSRKWALDMAQSAYATRYSRIARNLTLTSMFAFTSLCSIAIVTQNISHFLPDAIIAAGISGIVIGSLVARQYSTKQFLAITVFGLIVGFFVSGINGGLYDRPQIRTDYLRYQHEQNTVSADAELLRLGLTVYGKNQAVSKIPTQLRSGTGYIAPSDFEDSLGRAITPGSSWYVPTIIWVEPFKSVATEQQAASLWRSEGKAWLNFGVRYATERNAEGMRRYAISRNLSFDSLQGTYSVEQTLVLGAIGLILHLIATAVSRWMYRKYRSPLKMTQLHQRNNPPGII